MGSKDPENPPRFVFNAKTKKWESNPLLPSNIVYATLGTIILFFGWFAFNGGSAITITTSADTVERVILNSLISACAGTVSAQIFGKFEDTSSWSTTDPLNGLLIGLVAITPCCHIVGTGTAWIVGLVAGLVYKIGSIALLKIRVDDPLEACLVHGLGGALGVIMGALFCDPGNSYR
jgi:Amt family ammonium transporter